MLGSSHCRLLYTSISRELFKAKAEALEPYKYCTSKNSSFGCSQRWPKNEHFLPLKSENQHFRTKLDLFLNFIKRSF